MSDWIRYYRNRETKEIVNVHAMDDYFGSHVYGFRIIKTGEILNGDDFYAKYEGFKYEVVE